MVVKAVVKKVANEEKETGVVVKVVVAKVGVV